ncbi:MAG: 16S rRNA (adenine(1518)-N(6)/adenine(1519)-N(6))-dimethyltransferase RsmA [bacterium]|nr:16S rRNA (adenine(1518)-N(6)/adenine(1519)-N(6))-dimethyltransferase RsmA [bacterium]
MPTNKKLGQHWLKDRGILEDIADEAGLSKDDTVLEIGPGLGTLTSELLRRAKQVTAVEFDAELARKLPGQFPGKSLEVISTDILDYDLSALPNGYKVVANVPYYITSKIVQKLSETSNPPQTVVILVQKEVAERIAAQAGAMSMMSVSAQVFFEASLGIEVPREYFTPPPEVDSQTVILKRRDSPLIDPAEHDLFFRIVRAGYSERRKKLRSSLSGGLRLPKDQIDSTLEQTGISGQTRAQELSIEDWQKLMVNLKDNFKL